MPKSRSHKLGKDKDAPRRGLGKGRKNENDDDDESFGDSGSMLSANSDLGSLCEVENGNDTEECESSPQLPEAIEEKYIEAIEGLLEKSASKKMTSLTQLTSLLSQNFMPDIVINRKDTIIDHLEKILKRGQSTEKALAAAIVSLILIQIGSIDLEAASDIFTTIKPVLHHMLMDHTVPIPARIKSCQALCFGSFLAESGLDDLAKLMLDLEKYFENRVVDALERVKQENTPAVEDAKVKLVGSPIKIPKVNAANSDLICACISGWGLLCTLMPIEFLTKRMTKYIKTLQGFLEQNDLELRLSSGEALAILVEVGELHEIIHEESIHHDDDSTEEESGYDKNDNDEVNFNMLLERLKKLSVESQKFRTKKDRRQQRHSFRDYLHAIQEGEGPDQCIKFGHGETLDIDTWTKKRQYDAICQALGPGINRHLIDNVLIRQILELGPPKPQLSDSLSTRTAKNERHYINALNFKARCVNRGKNRDVRLANLSEF